MAFYSQPTAFGYSGFNYPATTFAPQQFAPQQAPRDAASQHEGSQAGEIQSHSVSGFAAQPIDAGFGGFYGVPQGATFIQGAEFGAPAAFPAYGQATVLPAAYGQTTFLPQQALVPVAAPVVRRPGYNERLVAWRNRQKAFNRYKKATKDAIRNSSNQHYVAHNQLLASTVVAPATYGVAAPTYFGAAQPTYIAGGFPAATYGQTFIGGFPYGTQFVPQGQFVQQGTENHGENEAQYNEFSYSNNNVEAQQEEPEIRGTQV